KENSKKFREVKMKRDNLEDVIKYEEIVQYTDSIIRLYELPIADRITYFEGYIAQLKAMAEKEKKKEQQMANAGFATFANSRGGKENMGKFYFYNITALGYGKNDFKTKWGQRSLEDDWRWSNKNTVQQISEINVDANNTATYIAEVNGE